MNDDKITILLTPSTSTSENWILVFYRPGSKFGFGWPSPMKTIRGLSSKWRRENGPGRYESLRKGSGVHCLRGICDMTVTTEGWRHVVTTRGRRRRYEVGILNISVSVVNYFQRIHDSLRFIKWSIFVLSAANGDLTFGRSRGRVLFSLLRL